MTAVASSAPPTGTRLPRLTALALALKAATGDITDAHKALVDACLVDVPALGWEAPYTLLKCVDAVSKARRDHEPVRLSFDEHGFGPFCQHGGIPFFCQRCGELERLTDQMVTHVMLWLVGEEPSNPLAPWRKP